MSNEFQDRVVSFIWKIANTLRGPYKESEYGKVILPFTVLRRLDWVLEGTKEAVLSVDKKLPGNYSPAMREAQLMKAAGQKFFNTSQYTFKLFLADPDKIADNVKDYVRGFSEDARIIFIDHFGLLEQIDKLDKANLLYQVIKEFTDKNIDLHPDKVTNHDMGTIFEELIRRFSEQSNETAGEHFTPREVIALMASLAITEDRINLTQGKPIIKVFDPACGTGGMLTAAEEYLKGINSELTVYLHGQEFNNESYAICRSDMLIKGQNPKNIRFGNSFNEDRFQNEHFNYMLCNPPYGVEWKTVEKEVRAEHKNLGMKGRFGIDLPRISDGQLLFVQHMIAKLPQDGTIGRIAVIMNGSPLFTGGAESGESEIRKWIIENDWLEAIVGLPTELFYNTGIATYIWIITNNKATHRRGEIQLIDATGFHKKRDRCLGSKRRELTDAHIQEITQLLGDYQRGPHSKIFPNNEFGYRRITVERPLRLNFSTASDRLDRLKGNTDFLKLGSEQQTGLLNAIASLSSDTIIKNRQTFTASVEAALATTGQKIGAVALKKLILMLAERDPDAEPCTDSKGRAEPDTQLRDFENIPLKRDVDAFFEAEVKPHAPDAWIEHAKTVIGYEIPFNRYFYNYVEPRKLVDIDRELKRLSTEIMQLLGEVAA